MPAQQFSSILDQIQTTDDVERVVNSLESFLSSLYTTNGKTVPEKMDELLPSHIARELKSTMEKSAINPQQIEEVKAIVGAIKAQLMSLRTVSLTLAFDPPQKALDDIASWVKQHFGSDTVMEIAIHPHILGGAVVVANGRYVDKSLKKKLDILFTVKRQEIKEMISNSEHSVSQPVGNIR